MTTKEIIALMEKAIAVTFAIVPGLQPLAPVAAAIPTVVDSVETVVGKGSGDIKKQAVATGAKTALAALDLASTGGQKNTVDRYVPIVDRLIDDVVDVFNTAGAFGNNGDPTGVSPRQG